MAEAPPLQLVLVRHGATEWSQNGRHTGRTDLPLLEQGEEDAKKIAPALKQFDFVRVLSSPLSRALNTCKLAGLGDRAETNDDLLEWDYGEYEGIRTVEIRETVPGWDVWSGGCPGGESAADVGARADRVLAELAPTSGDVAIFGHGHMLRVLAARWLELDPADGARFVLATATLSVLGWEHEWHAFRMWNSR